MSGSYSRSGCERRIALRFHRKLVLKWVGWLAGWMTGGRSGGWADGLLGGWVVGHKAIYIPRYPETSRNIPKHPETSA